MNLFSEFHIYASRDPNAQPVATEVDAESARATCRALAWKSGRNHFVVEKLMTGQNVEIFSAADVAALAAIAPGSSFMAGIAELEETAACASLTAQIEALIRETICLEPHEEVPGEWGVWAEGGDVDEPELMGAGMSRREALEDALTTAKGWAGAEGKHLTAELGKLALSGLSVDDGGCLSEAIPRPLAQQLCAALAFVGVSATWAPDGDNEDLCFVSVGSEPGPVV